MTKLGSLVLCVSLIGCGTVSNLVDNGVEAPLGGWAKNSHRIEALDHEDPANIYSSYGYTDGWSKTKAVASIIDFPFTYVADIAILPVTIPGYLIGSKMLDHPVGNHANSGFCGH